MKKFFKGLGAALGYFGVFLLIQFWVTMIDVLFLMGDLFEELGTVIFTDFNLFMDTYITRLLEQTAGVVLASNVISVAGIWLIFQLCHKNFPREIGLQKMKWGNLPLSILFGFGLCYTLSLVTTLLPIPEDMFSEFAQEHDTLFMGSKVLTCLSVGLIGPFAEEVFFRGLCYTRMKKGMPTILALILASALFGLAHGNLIWMLVAFLAGCGMAWIYETTGSLWASILVHMTNNLLAFASDYMPETDTFALIVIGSGVVSLIGSAIGLYFLNRKPRTPVPVIMAGPEY